MEPWLWMMCVLTTQMCDITGERLISKPTNPPEFVTVVTRHYIEPWKNYPYFIVRVFEETENRLITQVKSEKFVQGQGFYRLGGPGVDQEPKGLFAINEINGEIWTQVPVDREKHQLFTLKVWAVSSDEEILEYPVPLKFRVMDWNEHKPIFTQKVFYGSVPELSDEETPVMRVSATDQDVPMVSPKDYLMYGITGVETIPPSVPIERGFYIISQDGTIITWAPVPLREVVKAYRIGLLVADNHGTEYTDEAVAIINVTDINNHVPEFSPTSYHMSADENTLGEIGRVNVTDRDEPGTGNWEAKYSVSDDPHGYFSIRTDAETNQGILSVVKPLDLETVKEHNLTLHVENINPFIKKAPEVPVSTASVTITVVRENRAPYFTEDPIQITVPQNVLPGTQLKSDIAVDPENLAMCFEITEDPEDLLDINKDTGEILSKRSFNVSSLRVQGKVYTAAVKVTDPGGLSSTAAVHISMVEINHFAPQLSPLIGSVCKNRGNLTLGLVLTAVDEDLPPNVEPFSFEIPELSMTGWNVTQVNGTHAVLLPGIDLQSGVYQVSVMVSDSGFPTLHSSAHVKVTLCECNSSGDCQDSGMETVMIVVLVIIIKIALFLILWTLWRRRAVTNGEINIQIREIGARIPGTFHYMLNIVDANVTTLSLDVFRKQWGRSPISFPTIPVSFKAAVNNPNVLPWVGVMP